MNRRDLVSPSIFYLYKYNSSVAYMISISQKNSDSSLNPTIHRFSGTIISGFFPKSHSPLIFGHNHQRILPQIPLSPDFRAQSSADSSPNPTLYRFSGTIILSVILFMSKHRTKPLINLNNFLHSHSNQPARRWSNKVNRAWNDRFLLPPPWNLFQSTIFLINSLTHKTDHLRLHQLDLFSENFLSFFIFFLCNLIRCFRRSSYNIGNPHA